VRLLARLFLVVVAASLPLGLAVASCGTSAVGIASCRQIEMASCALAPTCDPTFDVSRCELFYRDECLVGIQNADAGSNLTAATNACVTALQAEIGCMNTADSGACQMLLPSGTFCPETDAAATPCSVLICPEVLTACAWLATPGIDAGADADGATVDADDAAADSGDAADATGE
jgi:hypothetical protein